MQGSIAAVTSMIRLQTVPITDKRSAAMNEIINSIRLIKMYAWEAPFEAKVREIRQRSVSKYRVNKVKSTKINVGAPVRNHVVSQMTTWFEYTQSEIHTLNFFKFGQAKIFPSTVRKLTLNFCYQCPKSVRNFQAIF